MNAPYSLCNSLFLPANVPGFVFFPLVCNNKWKSRAERMMCLNERKIYERCGVSNEGVLLVALRFLQMNRITIAHADPFFHEAADPYGVVNFTLFHSGQMLEYGTHLLQAWSKAIQRLTSHMLYTIEKSVDDLPSDLRSITDKLDRTLILSLTLSVRFVLALFCPCIHRWLVCLFRIRNVNSSIVTISIFFIRCCSLCVCECVSKCSCLSLMHMCAQIGRVFDEQRWLVGDGDGGEYHCYTICCCCC